MKTKRRLVIANWKANPPTFAEAKKIFLATKKEASNLRNVDVVVCPPAVYFADLRKLYRGKKLAFGAQDIFEGEGGSHTGEISAKMYRGIGADFAIVGHSERRAMGETDEEINGKVRAALDAHIRPVLCIGETQRDSSGAYLETLSHQLTAGFAGVPPRDLLEIVVAYEPVWAIGKSADDAMKPDAVHETVLYIRKLLTENYGRDMAMVVTILYGGSVEPTNAGMLLERGGIGGFLVGHASLEPEEFNEILQAAQYTE